jgi:hypothetical protein
MLFVLLALLAQPADTMPAPDSLARDIVYYGGKRVVFYAKKEEVVLLDSAWVRYRDMSVFSDSIHYDVKRHQLSAFADVLFTSGTENITGVELVYDIDSRKGMMRTARTEVDNGFFRAGEVWLVRERVLNARGGSYTTCSRDHPHYEFYGPRVKLLMDDVAIAEPVLFKLFHAPVLAAPFWLVPVANKRKSGLLPFKVGNSTTEGFYSKNLAYYWVINDYADATVYADLMTRKGLQGRLEGVYIVNPFASGNFNGSYIRELDTKRPRYSVTGQHESKFLFGSELSAKADFVSDATYVPDYSEEELGWLKPDIYSYAEITRSIRRIGSFSALAQQKTEYRNHYRYADLPSVKLSISSRPLPGGWTASPSASFGHHTDDFLDSTNTIDTARLREVKGSAALGFSSPQYNIGVGNATISEQLGFTEGRDWKNDSVTAQPRRVSSSFGAATDQKLFGALNLTEQVAVAHADNLRDTIPVAVTYTGSLTGRTTLYRVFSTTALGMNGLLHKVDPSIALSYRPKVGAGGLFGRPRFTDPDAAGISANLGNSFQTKVDTNLVKRDLGSVNFSTGYDLIAERFSPLRATAGFRPLQANDLNLSIDAAAGLDLETLKLREDYSIGTSFNWTRMRTDSASQTQRGFRIGLNHTFGADSLNMLKASATLAIPGWRFDLTELGYNIAKSEFANYGVIVTKDLHCWEAMAKLEHLGDKWSYDFEIRIKKLPDIKVGKGTFGSILPKIGN